MVTELIHTLYAYNAWANARILDTTARLSPQQFISAGSASFGSIRDTLVHTMSGQWIWLARWQGISPDLMFDPQAYPDLASIRVRWDHIEHDTGEFIAGVQEADMMQSISYTNTQGELWAYPLWAQMLHQVNHATQHRSEVAAMLTAYRCSPGWLDFLYFIDLQQSSERVH